MVDRWTLLEPMMSILEQETSQTPRFGNLGDVLRAFEEFPADRILLQPFPGTVTEKQLIALVEKNHLCELIDGTLVEKTVGSNESLLAARIIYLLSVFVVPRKLGSVYSSDLMTRMKSGNILLPDVAFIAKGKLKGGPSIVPFSADLAVEVFSPSNTAGEMARKRKQYFASGTRLLWEFSPKTRRVKVYTSANAVARVLQQSDLLDGGEVLPGFSVPVREIFAALDE